MGLHPSSLQPKSNPMYSSTAEFMDCLGLNFWCLQLKCLHSKWAGLVFFKSMGSLGIGVKFILQANCLGQFYLRPLDASSH